MSEGGSLQVREALVEIEEYLSDSLPPLLVVGSVRFLTSRPPELVADVLVSWAIEKGAKTPLEQAEQLGNALRRLARLVDLRLLQEGEFRQFLAQLQAPLLQRVPAEGRDAVRVVIYQIEKGSGQIARPEPLKDDQWDAFAIQTTPQNLARHLVPLIEKLAAALSKSGDRSAAEKLSDETVSRLVAAATHTAESPQQLEERLDRLKSLGVDATVPGVMRTLGQNVPNWAVTQQPEQRGAQPVGAQSSATSGQPAEPETAAKYMDSRLRAMQRLVELGQVPQENNQRFGQMVETAVEQFNRGAVARAVAILDSAIDLVGQGRIQGANVRNVWESAEGSINLARLSDLLSDSVQHDLLFRFLGFFPSFSSRALLNQIAQRSERLPHRLTIALLQQSGESTRVLIREELHKSLLEDDDIPADYVRDLLGVLSNMSPQDFRPADQEIDTVSRVAQPRTPLPLLRELVRYLEVVRHDGGLRLLGYLVPVVSTRLDQEAAESKTPESVVLGWAQLLERILTRLAQYDDSRSRHLVLEQCLQKRPAVPLSFSPLAVFGQFDLSSDPAAVSRLLTEVKRLKPWRFLRWFSKPRETKLINLIQAFAATSAPAVKEQLQDLANRFPETSFGIAAASALRRPHAARIAARLAQVTPAPDAIPVAGGPTPALQPVVQAPAAPVGKPAEALQPLVPSELPAETDRPIREGPLGIHELPTLLQHLSKQDQTGVLELTDASGTARGTVMLRGGKVQDCLARHLKGRDALLLLLEKPAPGRFRLWGLAACANGQANADSLPLWSILTEGMSRYDEYRQACLIIGDDAVFKPTNLRPTAPQDETDLALLRPVWENVVAGKTALECESLIPTDPFRVRRVLSHWYMEGSIQLAPQS